MTGIRTQFRRGLGAKLYAAPVVALVCLGLLALLAVVQVAHLHPLNSDDDHCPLCIVMHTAAPVQAPAPAIVLVEIDTPAPVFEVRSVLGQWRPTPFIRPPPIAS